MRLIYLLLVDDLLKQMEGQVHKRTGELNILFVDFIICNLLSL